MHFVPRPIRKCFKLSKFAESVMISTLFFLQAQAIKLFAVVGIKNVKGIGGYIGDDGVPRLNVLDLHIKEFGNCPSR